MDEFEREMLLMDLQDEAAAWDEKERRRIEELPKWWRVAYCIEDADSKTFELAKVTRNEFFTFYKGHIDKSLEAALKLFTAAKIQNKI